jgi:hypothetical protein
MRGRKLLVVLGAAAAIAGGTAGSALAGGPPDRAQDLYDPFVCPVITPNENAVTNSGKFNSLGNGEYTFGPGAAGSGDTFNGNVPLLATNGEGYGTPGVDHTSPGDSGYTAIWSGETGDQSNG